MTATIPARASAAHWRWAVERHLALTKRRPPTTPNAACRLHLPRSRTFHIWSQHRPIQISLHQTSTCRSLDPYTSQQITTTRCPPPLVRYDRRCLCSAVLEWPSPGPFSPSQQLEPWQLQRRRVSYRLLPHRLRFVFHFHHLPRPLCRDRCHTLDGMLPTVQRLPSTDSTTRWL